MKKILLFILISILSVTFSKTCFAYPNKGDVYSYDESNERNVYLTFDDGYSYSNTKKIFSILKEKNVKATFFLTGDFIKDASGLIKEMYDDNQIIGNHTWSHKTITSMSPNQLRKEIKAFEECFYEITGDYPVKFFRPPMGYYTEDKLEILFEMGYKVFFWSHTYVDYDVTLKYSKEETYKKIIGSVKPGDIILLHTMNKANIEALPDIIDYLLDNGYWIKNLDYLLNQKT